MPRIASDSDAMLKDLTTRLKNLIAAAKREGRDEAMAEVRNLVGGTAKRGPGRPRKSTKKPAKKKKRKNPWASMTPKQKAERVRKMLAGRGLKPKAKRKPAKKTGGRKPARKKPARKKPARAKRKPAKRTSAR